MSLQTCDHRMGRSVSKFYQSAEFKDIEKTWERLLFKSGFVDAERTKNGQRVLKNQSADAYRQASAETREARVQYYRNLCYHTYRTVFLKLIDRFVMTRRSDGVSIKQIVIEIEAHGGKIHRQTVRYIIRRYEHQWGIRFWAKEDRNLKHG